MHCPPHRVQNLDMVPPGEGRVPERSAHPPPVPGLCPWYQWPLGKLLQGGCAQQKAAVPSVGLGEGWLGLFLAVFKSCGVRFSIGPLPCVVHSVTHHGSYPKLPHLPFWAIRAAGLEQCCQDVVVPKALCATSVLGVSGGLCWAPGGFALSLPS